MHNRRSHAGFTIVELLIVIVVISILVAIVTIGYSAYQDNAKKTQIATAVRTYQDAVTGVAFEKDYAPGQDGTTAASCISSNTSTCCLYGGSGNAIACAKNSEFGAGADTSGSYNKIKKYIPNNPPKLPRFGKQVWPSCGTGPVTQTNPCDTQEFAFVQYYLGSGGTTESPKGNIVYYLPPNIDCQSPDVMIFTTSPNAIKYTSSPYTRRVTSGSTPFTECVVGIR